MIFVRHKDAKSLPSIATADNDPYYFPNLLFDADTIEIVFFENDKISIASFVGRTAKGVRLVAELERKNCPFILLVDKKCEIELSRYSTAVVNANCLPYECLEVQFPEKGKLTTSDNKSKLFHNVYLEFIEYYKTGNFKDNFDAFKRNAELEEYITKEVVFIAMCAKTGEIYNANSSIGKLYDSGKIWICTEEIIPEPKKIAMVEPINNVYIPDKESEALREFSEMYESRKSIVSQHKLRAYDPEELTEILTKYPMVFRDILTKKWTSFPCKSEYSDMSTAIDEELEEQVDEDPDNPFDFANVVTEYFAASGGATDGMKICCSCDDFCMEENTRRISIEGKLQDICEECLRGSEME